MHIHKRHIAFLGVVLFFVGCLVTLYWSSSRRFDKEILENKKKIENMIHSVRSSTFALRETINDTKIEINSELLSYFSSKNLDQESFKILKQVKEMPKYNLEKAKRLLQSIELVRKSVINYHLAIQDAEAKNYQAAKNKLVISDFYLNQAEEQIRFKNTSAFLSFLERRRNL